MPAPDYATLPELKTWLTGITGTDRDTILSAALAGASRWVDGYTKRRFYLDTTATRRSYPLRLAGTGSMVLVDDIGSLTDLAVDTGTLSGGFTVLTDYEVSPLNALATGWPVDALSHGSAFGSTTQTVRVTARWGWPAVPSEVTQATLIQAARLFKRKDSPEGVLGSSEWGTIRVSRVDPDVAALLAPYRRPTVA